MRKYMLALVLLAACSSRPLDTSCAVAAECTQTEWCVRTWGVEHSPAGYCASQCETDTDCDIGVCAFIGDGSTTDLQPKSKACR